MLTPTGMYAMNVRFYYMANALGRLRGTLAAVGLYTSAGNHVVYGLYTYAATMWSMVWVGAFASLSFAAAGVTVLLRDDTGGLMCGSSSTSVSGAHVHRVGMCRLLLMALKANSGWAAPAAELTSPCTAGCRLASVLQFAVWATG